MKTSTLTSSLFVAFTQSQAVSALVCGNNDDSLERCFATSSVQASSFCSSFIKAPEPIVEGFDCVTKEDGNVYPTDSVASICSCIVATTPPPLTSTFAGSVSVSGVTTYITVVVSTTVTITAIASPSTVTFTPDCSSSFPITSTFTTSGFATPSGAIAIVHGFADSECNVPAGSGPDIILPENVCVTVPANAVKLGPFTTGNYCSTDAKLAGCNIIYFAQLDCVDEIGPISPAATPVCLAVPNANSMMLFCGCD